MRSPRFLARARTYARATPSPAITRSALGPGWGGVLGRQHAFCGAAHSLPAPGSAGLPLAPAEQVSE